MGPNLPGSMPVVIAHGLGSYHFLFGGRVDPAAMKTALSGVMRARPGEMLLYHRGHPLTKDDQDLRALCTDRELRLEVVVTIFIPK